jgi:hypothetical protein
MNYEDFRRWVNELLEYDPKVDPKHTEGWKYALLTVDNRILYEINKVGR